MSISYSSDFVILLQFSRLSFLDILLYLGFLLRLVFLYSTDFSYRFASFFFVLFYVYFLPRARLALGLGWDPRVPWLPYAVQGIVTGRIGP